MKTLLSSLITILLFVSTKGASYAVQVCDDLDIEAFKAQVKAEGSEWVYMEQEGFYLFEAQDITKFEMPCFLAEVSRYKNHLALNTPTILLRLDARPSAEKTKFVNDLEMEAHDFIPDLFYLHAKVKEESALLDLVNMLQANALVDLVEVKQVFTLQAATNDPLYNRQWSIENTGIALQSNGTRGADMSVDSAWTLSEGSATIKIAILDSGVDTLHEDLINQLLEGYDGFQTDSTDTKGYPSPNFSSDGHGTACAGIAAAEANNNIGVAGIAHKCKIVPIRIFYYQDYGGSVGVTASTNTDAHLSRSVYAWRVANVDIMSTSAGLSPLFIGVLNINTQLMSDEINEAFFNGRNGYGVPMFFSAGNDDFNDVLWPADMENTIAVGASSMCDERKNPNDCSPENWGSSYGDLLDVVAPGVRITTCDMMGSNGYTSTPYTTTFNGTSAACPNAAGVGALILSLSPGLHARDVKAVLNLTADRVGNYNYDTSTIHGTWNEEMGHGRVNAFEALKLALSYESTVAIQDRPEVLQFSIYPNPNEGSFYIESSLEQEEEALIYNVLGEVLFKFRLLPGLHMVNFQLPDGVYFVSIPKLGVQQQFVRRSN